MGYRTSYNSWYRRLLRSVKRMAQIFWSIVSGRRRRVYARLKEIGGDPPFSNRPCSFPPEEETYKETDFRRD